MITFRRFNLAVAAIATLFLVACLVLIFFHQFPLEGLIAGIITCAVGWLVTVIIMAFIPAAGFYVKFIRKGDTDRKVVAISFDDGPDPRHTARIAEELKRLNVPATFFLIGSRIAGNEALLRILHSDGHLLGNHSLSHEAWYDLLPANRMAKGIRETNRLICEATGVTPRLFRPPFGVTNPLVSRAIRMTGMVPVGWSIRSFDTLNRDPQTTLNRILKRLSPGAVILLHDHSRFSSSHLEALITGIRKCGYSIASLDTVLYIYSYE